MSSAARALSSGMASPCLLRASLFSQRRPGEPRSRGNSRITRPGVAARGLIPGGRAGCNRRQAGWREAPGHTQQCDLPCCRTLSLRAASGSGWALCQSARSTGVRALVQVAALIRLEACARTAWWLKLPGGRGKPPLDTADIGRDKLRPGPVTQYQRRRLGLIVPAQPQCRVGEHDQAPAHAAVDEHSHPVPPHRRPRPAVDHAGLP